jgi:predicted PurR-regulated permease PerM
VQSATPRHQAEHPPSRRHLAPDDWSDNDGGKRDHATVALIERVFLVLLLGAAIGGVLLVMQPFAVSILFGASLATATWPLRQALVRCGWGRKSTAMILLLLSLCFILIPALVAAPHLADQLREGAARFQAHFASAPKQPAWLGGVPLVGAKLASIWDRLVEVEGDLSELSAPYAANIEEAILAAARALRDTIVQLILSLVMATVFWVSGDTLGGVLHDTLRRIGGGVAEHVLDVAASAIRGVAYGVIGTAVIQAVLLTAGLAVAGVPGAGMLGFVGLLIAISQIGAPLLIGIWGGAAWWLFEQDHQVWGIAMIGWGIFVSTIDNFIKPFLIGHGIQMPLSLTILAVLGGFFAFGFLGLFVGPTLIAVLFNLFQAWRAAQSVPDQEQL